MGLQWTVIAAIMYIELAVTALLVIPFISPNKWHKFFKSAFLRSLGNMSHIYFKVILFVLLFLFMDAFREQRKYGIEAGKHTGMLDADMQAQMKMFRAQRNLYICGAALSLWIIIRRLSSLLSELAITLMEKQAALKQAISASAVASGLISSSAKTEKVDDAELNQLKEENRRLISENEACLKQAKAVSREYDRLLEEHSDLQRRQKIVAGSTETKKTE